MIVEETYLKTRQVAEALGVSASTIKRWVDSGAIEATRTRGKHRLVTLSSALRFARQEKFSVENLLAMTASPSLEEIDDQVVEELANHLKSGRAREAVALIASVYQSSKGAVGLADHLIRPLMQRIGHGWEEGDWGIHHEHQATQIVSSAINALLGKSLRDPGDGAPLALGATPEGDPYVIGGLLAELVLREVGWDVRNLGTNLPLRSFAHAIQEYRPRLVFLSVSCILDRNEFIREYAYFYEAASEMGSAIMLGGRGLDLELRSNLVYASFGERMAHLAEFARRLLPKSELVVSAI